jgi:hypothetical protein
MIGRFDLDISTWLARLLSRPFRQYLQKDIHLRGVPLEVGLTGIEKLGRVFHDQLEA